jgi:hypothetical protein
VWDAKREVCAPLLLRDSDCLEDVTDRREPQLLLGDHLGGGRAANILSKVFSKGRCGLGSRADGGNREGRAIKLFFRRSESVKSPLFAFAEPLGT